jgi:thiol-disulfide isomerase/thioredoxin
VTEQCRANRAFCETARSGQSRIDDSRSARRSRAKPQSLLGLPPPAAPFGPSAPLSAPLGRAARWIVPLLVACALAALFWPRGRESYAAPAGLLIDAGGRPTPLARELAPVTLVHFWATWCPPCLTEIPALTRLITDFAPEGDFRVILVAVADRPATVSTFVGALAPRVRYDPQWEVAHRYGTEQVPETYVVVGARSSRGSRRCRLGRGPGRQRLHRCSPSSGAARTGLQKWKATPTWAWPKVVPGRGRRSAPRSRRPPRATLLGSRRSTEGHAEGVLALAGAARLARRPADSRRVRGTP